MPTKVGEVNRCQITLSNVKLARAAFFMGSEEDGKSQVMPVWRPLQTSNLPSKGLRHIDIFYVGK